MRAVAIVVSGASLLAVAGSLLELFLEWFEEEVKAEG